MGGGEDSQGTGERSALLMQRTHCASELITLWIQGLQSTRLQVAAPWGMRNLPNLGLCLVHLPMHRQVCFVSSTSLQYEHATDSFCASSQ